MGSEPLMRAFGKLTPFDEALKMSLEISIPIERTEKVKLEDALGRVHAQELISPLNVPDYTRAAMDGYALIADNTSSASGDMKVSLKIIGEIFAGDPANHALSQGECFKIATGGMLPGGANAVIPFEDIEERPDSIALDTPVPEGSCLGLVGEDIKEGDVILKSETLLHSAHIGAAASVGTAELLCYAKPVVAIAVSGDEIVEVGGELGVGQVYDTNSYTLSAVISKAGGKAEKLPIVRDSVENIEKAIQSSNADIITFTGGSSVGEKDLIVDAIKNLGEVIYHGITAKPGKPGLLGKVGDSLVVGMPGYPTSCLTIANVLLSPMIRKISRNRPAEYNAEVEVELGETITAKSESHQIVTVKIENGKAIPVFKGSSVITSMSNADGYVELPNGISELKAGELVRVTLL